MNFFQFVRARGSESACVLENVEMANPLHNIRPLKSVFATLNCKIFHKIHNVILKNYRKNTGRFLSQYEKYSICDGHERNVADEQVVRQLVHMLVCCCGTDAQHCSNRHTVDRFFQILNCGRAPV